MADNDTTEDIQRQARRSTDLQTISLMVLLARAGGSASFTEDEYREIVERYGGSTKVTIHFEQVRRDGRSMVELTLMSKPPAPGELVS